MGFFSSFGEHGLLPGCGTGTSHCGSFSCHRVQAVEHTGFSCGSWALSTGLVVVAHGLSCIHQNTGVFSSCIQQTARRNNL